MKVEVSMANLVVLTSKYLAIVTMTDSLTYLE